MCCSNLSCIVNGVTEYLVLNIYQNHGRIHYAQSDQRLFIRFLERIICKLAAGEIFRLVSIAEETGLKHSLLKPPPPPEDRCSHKKAHMIPNNLVFSEKKYPRKKITHQAFLHVADMEEGNLFIQRNKPT